MEPLFFKAENAQRQRRASGAVYRFNGAAFFQSGKLPAVRLWRCVTRWASMEPLFFKAENTPNMTGFPPLNSVLQWSRFFSKRKMNSGRSISCRLW